MEEAQRVARVALGLLVALAGCAGLGPAALDVPPGHRAVLGRVDLSRFEAAEALVELVRTDGTFRHDLRVGQASELFVITLPPGTYRVARVRAVDEHRVSPRGAIWELSVAFDIRGDAAVYLGTLRLVSGFGRVDALVVDDYAATVAAARARHPALPEPVARSLFRPS